MLPYLEAYVSDFVKTLQEEGLTHAQLFLGFWIETTVKSIFFFPRDGFPLFLLMRCRIVLGILFKMRVVYEQTLTCFHYLKKNKSFHLKASSISVI